MPTNTLYYGDNLPSLREHLAATSMLPLDLDPPDRPRVWWAAALDRAADPPPLGGGRRAPVPAGVYQLDPPCFVVGDDFNAVLAAPTGAWLGRLSADWIAAALRFSFHLDAEGWEVEAPAGWAAQIARWVGEGEHLPGVGI